MQQRLLGYQRRKKSFVFNRKPSFSVCRTWAVTGFLIRASEPSPSSLSEKPAADFGGKITEPPFCRRFGYGPV
jgi:hypothetical protein